MKGQLAEGVVMFGSIALKLFGQAATAVEPGLVALVGNLGIVGVLVWHLWYHTTHSYPKMLEQFGKESEKLRESFSREQAEARASFLREQQAMRDNHSRETAELRNILTQSMNAMRSAVHDVKDTAQTAINEKALALAQSMVAGDPGKAAGS